MARKPNLYKRVATSDLAANTLQTAQVRMNASLYLYRQTIRYLISKQNNQLMSQTESYQSVLKKLSDIPAEYLSQIEDFLSQLSKQVQSESSRRDIGSGRFLEGYERGRFSGLSEARS